jgi:hypothetical protein
MTYYHSIKFSYWSSLSLHVNPIQLQGKFKLIFTEHLTRLIRWDYSIWPDWQIFTLLRFIRMVHTLCFQLGLRPYTLTRPFDITKPCLINHRLQWHLGINIDNSLDTHVEFMVMPHEIHEENGFTPNVPHRQ